MLALYADSVESDHPLSLDDYAFPHDPLPAARRFDIRAVRIGDSLSLTWRDVTERHEASARVAASERHYRLLAENSSDVVVHTRHGIVLWVSPSLTRTLGWTTDAATGVDIRKFVHPDDRAAISEQGRADNGTRVTRIRLHSIDGEYHWCDVHSSDFFDENGDRDGTVSSFRVVDDAVAAERELERRAMYDDLTGVYLRDEALQRLIVANRELARGGTGAAVLFCDVDNLKQVNDENGHAMGDELLRTLSRRLQGAIRTSDTIARVGGDEFLIILAGVPGLPEAKALADKIRAVALEPIEMNDVTFVTSLSIGLTMIRAGEGAEETIARADRAMYEAKRAGRNTVRTLSPQS